jgi:hypothetical protein
MNNLSGIREFAKLAGVAPSTIAEMKKKKSPGLILQGGKIVVDKSLEACRAYNLLKNSELIWGSNGTKAGNKTKEAPEPEQREPRQKPIDAEYREDLPSREEVENNPLKETDDRAKIEKYLAFQKYEKERIANEKSKNELIRLNDVTDKIFKILRPLRDDLQAFSKRNAPIIHMSESRHEAVQVSQEEIDRILLSRIGGEFMFDDDLKKKITEMLTR